MFTEFRHYLTRLAFARSPEYRARALKRFAMGERLLSIMDKALLPLSHLMPDSSYRAGALVASDGVAVLLQRALVDIDFLFGASMKKKAQTSLELRTLLRSALVRCIDRLNRLQKAVPVADKPLAVDAAEYNVAYCRANLAFHNLMYAFHKVNRWLPQ